MLLNLTLRANKDKLELKMFKEITAELDNIAAALQKRGEVKLAARLDIVSNTLDLREATLKPKKVANPNDMMPKGPDMNPGSEDADEAGRSDAFEAKNYHKVPVGKDSMSKFLGIQSPDDINLDFAQDEGEINIQATKRRATSKDIDVGDAADHFSTAGLPESGNETRNPPIDKDQKGSDLEFFGFEPAGKLHMPNKASSKSSKTEDVTMNPREARKLLERAAAEVIVDDPKDLHQSEEGEDVERDQSLGGKGKKSSRLKVAMEEDDDATSEEDSDDEVDDLDAVDATLEFAGDDE